MQKLFLSSVAAVALAASASAFAQLPLCQRGLVWGGCQSGAMGSSTRVLGAGPSSIAVPPAGPVRDLQPYALGVANQTLPDGRVIEYSKQYPRTAADLDGDGVPNRYDRFPNDPRFF
jgi:hypothetical protein